MRVRCASGDTSAGVWIVAAVLASKVLRAGMWRFIRCDADVVLHQVGCVLVNVIACTNACVRAQVARFPGY